MREARCKNCGQLVEPGVNKTCPACHQPLDNNIVFSASSNDRWGGSRTGRKIKTALVRLAVGLIFLYLFFYVFFPKMLNNMQNRTSQSQSTSAGTSAGASVATDNKGDKQVPSTKTQEEAKQEVKPEQTYFIRVSDMAFGQETLDKLGKHDPSDILTFKIKEYLNGDIWINEKTVVMVPFEKVVMGKKECWLLFLEKHVSIASQNFPSSYDEASPFADTNKKMYDSKKVNIYNYYMDRVLAGEEFEAVYISEWDDNHVALNNIKFHYEFEDYKKIQTADGIVYELADGTRVTDYMQIPHSFVVDKEGSAGTTVLSSEIVLDE